MIELLELKFSRRWQTNKIESDWSNSPRHSSSRQFRSPRALFPKFLNIIFTSQKHRLQINVHHSNLKELNVRQVKTDALVFHCDQTFGIFSGGTDTPQCMSTLTKNYQKLNDVINNVI